MYEWSSSDPRRFLLKFQQFIAISQELFEINNKHVTKHTWPYFKMNIHIFLLVQEDLLVFTSFRHTFCPGFSAWSQASPSSGVVGSREAMAVKSMDSTGGNWWISWSRLGWWLVPGVFNGVTWRDFPWWWMEGAVRSVWGIHILYEKWGTKKGATKSFPSTY